MAIKITFYGHAILYLETGGYKLLVDPFFKGNPQAPAVSESLDVDYILVSHGHGDHIGDTVAIAKRSAATVITNTEISSWLKGKGISKIHTQHIGGGFTYPFGYLKLTQATHASMMPDGTFGGSPAGYLLTTTENEKIYIAGDTGLFGDMRLIGEEGIDLALLPIGDNFTMGPEDALRAVKLIQPKHVIPIHYNTWDVITQDAHAWAARVSAETQTKAHVLKPGESVALP